MDKKNNIRRTIVAMQIKDAMDAHGMTRKQLADRMGKTPSEVTRWLSGKHNFTIDLLEAISEAVGARITGVIVDGFDGNALRGDTLMEPGGSAVAYPRHYCIGPIELPSECFHKLERKAEGRGESLKAFVEGLLIKESAKPSAKASDFCGIWKGSDFDMSAEELVSDIKSHRTVHKEVPEL